VDKVALVVGQTLRFLFLSVCFFVLVSPRLLLSQDKDTNNQTVPQAARQKLEPIIKSLVSSPSSHPISAPLTELMSHEHVSQLQAMLEKALLDLVPTISILASCESKKCQLNDFTTELLHVVETTQAIADFLLQDRLYVHKSVALDLAQILDKTLLSSNLPRLSNGEQLGVMMALVRLSDRFGSEISLDNASQRTAQLLKVDLSADEQGQLLAALIALYQSTAEITWLLEAEKVADQLLPAAGKFSCKKADCLFFLQLGLQTLNLFNFTGSEPYREFARQVLDRALQDSENLEPRATLEAINLQHRFVSKPFHVTVVGAKTDPAAQILFKLARTVPVAYRRLEWWDRSQGALPNPDVRYPTLKRAAAFICVNSHCSLPLFSEAGMQQAILKIFNKS
jgi:hypothetical protein